VTISFSRWTLFHRIIIVYLLSLTFSQITSKLEPGYLSCAALGYGLGDREFGSRQGVGIFLFTTASRPVLGPTHLLIHWTPGALSLGVNDRIVKLTTHLHLVPRWRICGSIPPLSQYAFIAWCSVEVKYRDNFTSTLPSYRNNRNKWVLLISSQNCYTCLQNECIPIKQYVSGDMWFLFQIKFLSSLYFHPKCHGSCQSDPTWRRPHYCCFIFSRSKHFPLYSFLSDTVYLPHLVILMIFVTCVRWRTPTLKLHSIVISSSLGPNILDSRSRSQKPPNHANHTGVKLNFTTT